MDDGVRDTADRGRYTGVASPWDREAWRREALGWAEARLAERGLREEGPRTVRVRPWSVLVRMTVASGGVRGPVWFKANPPASVFEAGLAEALARWVPGCVLTPLAVEASRGWSLLPDGGPLLRDALAGAADGPRVWEDVLRRYAQAQRALTPYAERIERLGVPGARTAALPDVFDGLVARNTALDPAERARLHALRPRIAQWCAELADAGVDDSLDHADLHDGQIFTPAPGRHVFFDWGDAAVSHPFCSLTVPLRAVAERYGPEVLPRLRDAYLEPWTAPGRPASALRRAARLATRLGAISRAASWGRDFPEAAVSTATDPDAARWLRAVGDERARPR